MITTATLRAYTWKDLAKMAKERGIRGWHSMRKDQLVRSLVKAANRDSKAPNNSEATGASQQRDVSKNGGTRRKASNTKQPDSRSGSHLMGAHGNRRKKTERPPKNPRVHRVIKAEEQMKDLSQISRNRRGSKGSRDVPKDRVIVMVRDPFWLHVFWELTRRSVERARASMAQQWHAARPTLRLYEIQSGPATHTSATVIREIEIHSGVTNWYVDLQNPPGTYRVDIGYTATDGSFYALSHSNLVTTPAPGSSDTLDEHWSDVAADCEQIYAQSGGYDQAGKGVELQEVFEERLRRPMGSPMITRYGAGAQGLCNKRQEFNAEVNCELIVYGMTDPDAYVTLAGEPVKLRPDGSFTVRMSLPEKRQVIPVVADSSDGLEQRTTVLAVERNTKIMEPVTRDPDE